MGIINEADKADLKNMLADMIEDVRLLVFVSPNCNFCAEMNQICSELAGISDKISAETHELGSNIAKEYNVDKSPCTAIVGKEDPGIRFYGVPVGYEFTGFVEDIIDISRDSTDLAPDTKETLAGLEKDIHLQVFVTPTCPYCPTVVRLSHKLAIESTNIRADMVESTQFKEYAARYGVMGVPRTIINETGSIEGAMPERVFVRRILEQ